MKRIFFISLTIVLGMTLLITPAAFSGDGAQGPKVFPEKVKICHNLYEVEGPVPDQSWCDDGCWFGKIVTVSHNACQAHVDHGDYVLGGPGQADPTIEAGQVCGGIPFGAYFNPCPKFVVAK